MKPSSWLLLAVLHVSAPVLGAQSAKHLAELRGRISQSGDTTVGVVGAEIHLVPGDRREYAGAAGRFHFTDLSPGAYELRVRRIGYRRATRRVVVEAGRVNTADVELARAAHALSEVVIEGRRVKVPPRYEDVYARAARGWGKLFTRDDIERLNPLDLTSLLATVPTVLMTSRGICFKRCQAELGRAPRPACSPSPNVQVYVDGVRMTRRLGDADRVIREVYPSSVEAMEVYTGVARIPAEFVNDACAVIAIWTRSY